VNIGRTITPCHLKISFRFPNEKCWNRTDEPARTWQRWLPLVNATSLSQPSTWNAALMTARSLHNPILTRRSKAAEASPGDIG
jgi:hypothetical protein